jgi:hypothetical protein
MWRQGKYPNNRISGLDIRALERAKSHPFVNCSLPMPHKESRQIQLGSQPFRLAVASNIMSIQSNLYPGGMREKVAFSRKACFILTARLVSAVPSHRLSLDQGFREHRVSRGFPH